MRKRLNGPRFTLYWKEKDVFILNRPSEKIYRGQWDSTWIPRFRAREPMLLKERDAVLMWKAYEYVRLTQKPELPPLSLVQHRRRDIEMFEDAEIKIDLVDYLSFQFGSGLGAILRAAPEGFAPNFVIKRKGKSINIIRNYSNEHMFSSGVYTLFENEDDVFLTKIALGKMVDRYYDLRDSIARFDDPIGKA